MARIARVVAPGIPHHVTQRGNRRQETFFCDENYRVYIALMAEWCSRFNVDVLAYCLMPNHTHLLAVPETQDSLREAIGEAHRRYTRQVNFRLGWRGHLWQGRFASFPMDEKYLLAAARYVELNPVRAGIAEKPGAYAWSSAAAHLAGRDDQIVKVGPLLKMVGDWQVFLSDGVKTEEAEKLDLHERTGRPLGSESFVRKIERRVGRILRRQKPGPKRRHYRR